MSTENEDLKKRAVEIAKKEGITLAAAAATLKPKLKFKVQPKPKKTVTLDGGVDASQDIEKKPVDPQ